MLYTDKQNKMFTADNPNNDILEEEVTNRTTSDSDAAISKGIYKLLI